MTDRERAIVMAYTGVVMLAGDKLGEFYKYVSEKAGRPVFTHEMQKDFLKDLSRDDFVELCAGEQIAKPEIKQR